MTSFQLWEYNNLVRFAAEANERMHDQQKEIETLKEDLRVALDAYRTLVVENARERH
tara:strand:- start:212 stop:382 length:171 start_codon:yes stop_codon:yes gene_type:complete